MSVQKKREARLEAVKNGSKKPFARKSEKSKTKKKHQHKPIKRLKKKKIDPVNQ
jgi:hypothetical protein